MTSDPRPRARALGVANGIFPPGPLNAITDVPDVRVGHATVVEGESVHTGVTAILPHGGDLFGERVPAAVHVGNGYGKLTGLSQVDELGELETPVLLTSTLSVWTVADALVEWVLKQPAASKAWSVNPVVGETNDGFLNDGRRRAIRREHVFEALDSASTGPVAEGAVGAGTGTVAFGWKGGIGTSSRRLPDALGGYLIGALVQSNFGGTLTINGAPVGRELGHWAFRQELDPRWAESARHWAELGIDGLLTELGCWPDGSIMMVVATDAPLRCHNLERLAKRALVGLARTGATLSNGSGDYVIAFSTAQSVRTRGGDPGGRRDDVPNEQLSPLFQAVAEATEEAVYNSLFRAEAVRGHHGAVESLPIPATVDILKKYSALNWDETLPTRT